MRWALRILGLLLFAGGVAAHFVEPVGFNERAHLGKDAVGAGLHLSVPFRDQWTHRRATGRLVFQGRDAVRITTKDGPEARVGLAADYALVGSTWAEPESLRTAVTTATQKALAELAWRDLLDGEKLGARVTALRTTLNQDPRWTVSGLRLLGVALADEGPAQQAQIEALQKQLGKAHAAEQAARTQLAEARGEANAATAATEAEWDKKDAAVRMQIVADVARIEGEASVVARRRRAEGDAAYERLVAEGHLAQAMARAETDAELATALKGPGVRWLNAIDAARGFRVDPEDLPQDPEARRRLRSLARWRSFFLE